MVVVRRTGRGDDLARGVDLGRARGSDILADLGDLAILDSHCDRRGTLLRASRCARVG
jgi:hypothetical protein